MPRQARLNAPLCCTAFRGIMASGMKRGRVFVDEDNREGFVNRLGALAASEAVLVYGW